MGLMWSFVHPLLMLAVYTFVFSVVFEAKWGTSEERSSTDFALILFVGLILHGLLAEVLNQAPGLITRNTNYVKKVVFPLEILPIINVGAALFHATTGFIVLLLSMLILKGTAPWTLILLPLTFLPLLILAAGISWLLSSMGVFVRDIGQATSIIAMVLLFVSPVFFPASAIPESFRPLIALNPLTFIIEETRAVVIWGRVPDIKGLALYTTITGLFTWLCFAWFQKTRKGFPDVL